MLKEKASDYAITVRVALRRPDGKYLTLQKSTKSDLAAGQIEYPGGKASEGKTDSNGSIPVDKYLAPDLLESAAKREVQEETGININGRHLDKVAIYSYPLAYRGSVRLTEVHTYTADITDDESEAVIVDNTINETTGVGSEDKHAAFAFYSSDELVQKEQEGNLLKNTVVFQATQPPIRAND